LKTITRSIINEHNIGENIVYEKKVMEMVNFPLIMNLCKSYKDENAVHFLMNYIKGEDMFEMLNQVDLLDNDEG